jgi:hypothetical protein
MAGRNIWKSNGARPISPHGTLDPPIGLFAAVGSGVEVAVVGIFSRVAIVAFGTLLYVLISVAIASAGS